MSNWEDRFETELLPEEPKAGFVVSFKTMGRIVDAIEEGTRTVDDKHPKNELLKIWGSLMFVMLILFAFSYNILIVATAPFIFFYGYVLIKLAKAWKRFNYKLSEFWGMTIGGLILELAAVIVIRNYIL